MLTNLAHLDWLCATVTPPPQPDHTTYLLDQQPDVDVLWTYAERDTDGGFRRTGGGRYDPVTGRYGQGAFNADDISRAAVVYLRHWRATGAPSSRCAAYQLLRGLTYLQAATGPGAGNVVLWMQPDGTLNRTGDPPDRPAPSDAADSYWLARTVWALGEGYAAFRDADPDFAAFLAERMSLALTAIARGPLTRYGESLPDPGGWSPAWLISDAADATGEALLGLSAYVTATGDPGARTVLARLAEGVAAMDAGDPFTWPYGAVLPWPRHRSVWHAWAGLAPAGLAAAYEITGDARLRDAALADAAAFTPHLLVASGPDNGWLPAPADRTQLAYGAHSRLESLLRVEQACGCAAATQLAGVAAAWFFGANRVGVPMYDPVTGRARDGVSGKGEINWNAGAESTIHALLAMLALDARADVAALARTATVSCRRTGQLVEAEHGRVRGGAVLRRPAAHPLLSRYSGGGGVRLDPGGQVRLRLPPVGRAVLMPVVGVAPGAGTTRWVVPGTTAGTVDHDACGGPDGTGDALAVFTLPTALPAAGPTAADAAVGGPAGSDPAADLTVTAGRAPACVDAVLVQPEVEWLVLAEPGTGHATALVRGFARADRQVTLRLPGCGPTEVSVYDPAGRLRCRYPGGTGRDVAVVVVSGGCTVARR